MRIEFLEKGLSLLIGELKSFLHSKSGFKENFLVKIHGTERKGTFRDINADKCIVRQGLTFFIRCLARQAGSRPILRHDKGYGSLRQAVGHLRDR